MLTEYTIVRLSALRHDPQAKMRACWMPIGGIVWDDEIDFEKLGNWPTFDMVQIVRMFELRVHVWKHEPLSEDERKFWNEIHSQLPTWAFFQRLTITDKEQQAQDYAAEDALDFARLFRKVLSDAADTVTVTEMDEYGRVAARWTIKKPLWRRILNKFVGAR
jgi:hypothetical protein